MPGPQCWHQRHQSTPRVRGCQGRPEPQEGGDGGQKHQGMWGRGSGVCPLHQQWLQELTAAGCRSGAVGLGVPLTCPHTPGCSMPYPPLVCPPGLLPHTKTDPMTQDCHVFGGLQGRHVLCMGTVRPPYSTPSALTAALCVQGPHISGTPGSTSCLRSCRSLFE